jgi:hypothetical protein
LEGTSARGPSKSLSWMTALSTRSSMAERMRVCLAAIARLPSPRRLRTKRFAKFAADGANRHRVAGGGAGAGHPYSAKGTFEYFLPKALDLP